MHHAWCSRRIDRIPIFWDHFLIFSDQHPIFRYQIYTCLYPLLCQQLPPLKSKHILYFCIWEKLIFFSLLQQTTARLPVLLFSVQHVLLILIHAWWPVHRSLILLCCANSFFVLAGTALPVKGSSKQPIIHLVTFNQTVLLLFICINKALRVIVFWLKSRSRTG